MWPGTGFVHAQCPKLSTDGPLSHTLRRIASLSVSHISYDEKRERHKKAECRKGRHLYGPKQSVGAGIYRQVCATCSAVTIDLTNVHELAGPVMTSQRSLSAAGRRGA
jgi:hypothetical protein